MPWNVLTDGGKRTEREILKFPVGLGAIRSVVIKASSVVERTVPDAEGYANEYDNRHARTLLRGQILAKDPIDSTKYVPYGTGDSYSIAVDATGGTFTISVDGETTSALAYNASAAAVEAALEALSTVDEASVSGGPGDAGGTTPYTVQIVEPAGASAPTTGAGSLTGGGASAVVTASSLTPTGVLDNDVEFVNGTSGSDEAANMLFFGCIFDASALIGYAGNEAAVAAALPTCRFE